MPAGIPVGALAIGEPGAKNAALLAISILALRDEKLRAKWEAFRTRQTRTVRQQKLPAR
jgi:5-(carboxyamino)imidazole ribonucleotide mutase